MATQSGSSMSPLALLSVLAYYRKNCERRDSSKTTIIAWCGVQARMHRFTQRVRFCRAARALAIAIKFPAQEEMTQDNWS